MPSSPHPPYIAFIPARGGSKGLPGKNRALFHGVPLVECAVRTARSVPHIGRVLVSTDDPAIAECAKRAGAEVPFLRPPRLARDDSPMLEAIRHCLDWLDNEPGGTGCRALVHLPPTTPQRTTAHVEAALDLYERKKELGENPAAVMTVSPTPDFAHPSRLVRIVTRPDLPDGFCRMIPSGLPTATGTLCHRNGACIVLDPSLPEALNLKAGPVFGLLLHEPLVSIDNENDLSRAEQGRTPMSFTPCGTDMAVVFPLHDSYHPRKALVLADDSSLAYYDPSGTDIYRRQQLVDDPWFGAALPPGDTDTPREGLARLAPRHRHMRTT